jgi:TetR/AcrR family transcriptional regulator, transcriptional repressor for nem operon
VSKGERTREHIIERATEVFNCRGYAGASMSEIMSATGLNKGGIYNHFKSKEELALASFDYAVDVLTKRLVEAVDAERHAADKLLAVLRVFVRNVDDAPFPGGCPLLNMAIESDDSHPELRERVRVALGGLQRTIRRIAKSGAAAGELRPTVDVDGLASVFVATLEGALMLSNLYKDPVHMDRAVQHLSEYVETSIRT